MMENKPKRRTRALIKRRRNLFINLALAMILIVTGAVTIGSHRARAAVGDVPDHVKSIKNNGDGTYELSLSVTGDADTTVQTAANVNVLVVIDTSNSMTSNGANGSSGWNANGPYRADAAEKVVYDFAHNLYQYKDGETGTNIQMALMTFNHGATLVQNWTSTEGDITGKLSSTGDTNSRRLTYHSGTNWEVALRSALTTLGTADKDPTFVIFVTDGAPSQVYGTADGTFLDASQCYGPAQDEARSIQIYDTATHTSNAETSNTQMFGIYAYGREADYLDDVIYYAVNGTKRASETAATVATENYYNASNTEALQDAIEDIFGKIVQALGVADVEIDDGTTNQVTTTSDVTVELLEVVEEYTYWLSIPLSANNTFTRIDAVSGETVTYTVSQDGKTVSWGSGSNAKTVTVNGTISGGKLTYQWTAANDLYDKAPPAAQLVNGTVQWDLSELGTLLDKVTYTVKFDVYPSQTTYDIIARLKNGDMTYAEVEAQGLDDYIVDEGGGSYSLRTNTNATVYWDDTRDDEGRQHDGYTNPDPVGTDAETLIAIKEWEGGEADTDSLEMTILMDDEPFHTATLSKPDWQTSSFISIGIIKNGQVLSGAEGHDFKFAELDDTQYHWELETPTVRPMLIDGTKTMLVKVDAEHQVPSGAATYTIDGATYYADTSTGALTAVNHRRSNLNLTKVVTGEDAPKDATFPFTLTVNNAKAPATEPTDDPEHNSDYWVWFSIYDTKAGAVVTDASVTGATGPNADGYYYAKSGSAISVAMKDGWNLRFINLPSGTTYTFVEGTLPQGFAFNKSELTQGEDSTFSGAQTTTGKIENTKTSYYVQYTNDYSLTNLEITKAWADGKNQDGLRLTADELKEILTLAPEVDGAEPTVVDNGDDTYTITYTGLPRFNNGEEVEYTVTEGAIEGYTTEGSPAKDHGMITNTHTPAVTDITVTKQWDDAENQDGIRPDSVTVQLKADGTVKETVTLNAENAWKHTWKDLPVYSSGEEIEYTVAETETNVITGTDGPGTYAYEVTGDAEAGFTVKNTHTPETVEATVTKVWDDAENQDGKRPESITINLLANGEKVDSKTVTEEDGWSWSWTNLDKYKDGKLITYTITEDPVTDYTTEISGYNVTNTHVPEKISISGEKKWEDADDQDGLRPDEITVILLADGEQVATTTAKKSENWKFTFTNLDKYAEGEEIVYTVDEEAIEGYEVEVNGYVLINTHIPELINVPVEKKWEDADNQDGKRPDSVTINLLADGDVIRTAEVKKADDGTWSYTFNDLPKYRDQGTEIKYTVTEDAVDGYTTVITGSAVAGYTVTNTHTPELTEVSGTKVWNDNNNQDGKRPASITINLLANGEKVDSKTVTKDDGWKWTFTNIPKYSGGEEITYTFTEDAVEDYTTTYSTDTLTVFNAYTPEQTSVTVTKVWDDDDNRDGVRTSSVTIHLLADATDTGKSVTLNSGNSWTGSFTGLDKYRDEGTEIKYTVTEDAVASYTTAITGDATEGYTVTNTHEPAKTWIPGTKTWNDADDQDGKRPESVTVILLADGVETAQTTATKAGGWAYSFEDLYVYRDGGTKIVYTVKEAVVPDYTSTVSGYDLVNTHEPEKTEYTVIKVWDDENDQDQIRPDSVTVQLTADGENYGDAVTLNDANKWTYTWTGLDAYKSGQRIVYAVDETAIPEGYTKEIDVTSTTAESGMTIHTATITNKHERTYGDLKITKSVPVYEDSGPVSFVFHVVATMPKGAKVYDDIVVLTFEEAGTESAVLVGKIPVGAKVVVTEIDSGAGYVLTSDNDLETTIISKDSGTAEVTFENRYDDILIHGHAILNVFTNDGTGWTVQQKEDTGTTETAATPAETER